MDVIAPPWNHCAATPDVKLNCVQCEKAARTIFCSPVASSAGRRKLKVIWISGSCFWGKFSKHALLPQQEQLPALLPAAFAPILSLYLNIPSTSALNSGYSRALRDAWTLAVKPQTAGRLEDKTAAISPSCTQNVLGQLAPDRRSLWRDDKRGGISCCRTQFDNNRRVFLCVLLDRAQVH